MKSSALVRLCVPVALLTFGCVTATPEPAPAPVAAVQPVSLEASPSAGDDWQKTLIDDLEAVESRGDVFLNGAFKLYDQLLSEETVSAERQKQLDAEVTESSRRYDDLVKAITHLKTDLANKDIRAALPLEGDEGKTEFDAVNELFTFYKPQSPKTGTYDTKSGRGVTSMLFADSQLAAESGLESLPKQQRDALMLLDYLRLISNDLAYVSNSVTDWIDVSDRDDLEAFAH